VNHCAHGGGVTIQHVLDWQPFTSFTTRDELQGTDIVVTVTTSFTQHEAGTNATMYFACEPADTWPQLEAAVFPVLELSGQELVAMLDHPTTAG